MMLVAFFIIILLLALGAIAFAASKIDDVRG
jgi:hypothetical protein